MPALTDFISDGAAALAAGKSASDHLAVEKDGIITFNTLTQCKIVPHPNNGFAIEEDEAQYKKRIDANVAFIANKIKTTNPRTVCFQEFPPVGPLQTYYLKGLADALNGTGYVVDPKMFTSNGNPAFGQFTIYDGNRYAADNITTTEVAKIKNDPIHGPSIQTQADYIQIIRLNAVKPGIDPAIEEIANVHYRVSSDRNAKDHNAIKNGRFTMTQYLLSTGRTVVGDTNTANNLLTDTTVVNIGAELALDSSKNVPRSLYPVDNNLITRPGGKKEFGTTDVILYSKHQAKLVQNITPPLPPPSTPAAAKNSTAPTAHSAHQTATTNASTPQQNTVQQNTEQLMQQMAQGAAQAQRQRRQRQGHAQRPTPARAQRPIHMREQRPTQARRPRQSEQLTAVQQKISQQSAQVNHTSMRTSPAPTPTTPSSTHVAPKPSTPSTAHASAPILSARALDQPSHVQHSRERDLETPKPAASLTQYESAKHPSSNELVQTLSAHLKISKEKASEFIAEVSSTTPSVKVTTEATSISMTSKNVQELCTAAKILCDKYAPNTVFDLNSKSASAAFKMLQEAKVKGITIGTIEYKNEQGQIKKLNGAEQIDEFIQAQKALQSAAPASKSSKLPPFPLPADDAPQPGKTAPLATDMGSESPANEDTDKTPPKHRGKRGLR